ncbi:WecB/TagA/CpsF family glycosyltransferase [Aquipuribacter sp. MA13-6]|uniref:WecB/TagA/CpsF family glycosyltransferase n=1 Tax=unclassified Aquipuribacter TaxID=2635084 RepID=UPI003EEFCC99
MPHTMSVVVPAHDEEAVLGRCLAWLDELPVGEVLTVVAANGCTDGTVALAQRLAAGRPDVLVLDLPAPGKAGAIRAGDDAAGDVLPRVYLDADIAVDVTTLRGLRDALDEQTAPRVAAPRPRFRLDGRPWPVRAFYDVFEALPYARDGLVGLGVYAVNREGHARVGGMPDVVADDLYVQRMFDRTERLVVAGTFDVQTPRTTAALVKVRTRVAQGNAELADDAQQRPELASSAGSTGRALLRLAAARPSAAAAVACYVGVTAVARLRARGGTTRWERDTTTRTSEDPRERVQLDMLGFDPLTSDEVVEHVLSALQDGRGGVIVTPNVDIMQRCRDPRVATLFRSADLVLADGAPVVIASRLAGDPLPERVTGSGLVPQLSAASAESGRSVFLLGGAPGIAVRAAAALQAQSPQLRVVGTYCPPMGFESDPDEMRAIEKAVTSAAPDIVFVALGAPKQELLSAHLADLLPGTWFLGCGAALTMVAGDVARAPGWVQRVGGEWIHRLVMEPRRMARRYLVDGIPYALQLMLWSLRASRRPDAVQG